MASYKSFRKTLSWRLLQEAEGIGLVSGRLAWKATRPLENNVAAWAELLAARVLTSIAAGFLSLSRWIAPPTP
jgi:hypothetical protein